MKNLEISIVKWFDNANGNSYFAGTIQADGTEYKMPFQYGYGDQWEYETSNVLAKAGLIPDASTRILRYCRENNISCHSEVREVDYKTIKAYK